MNKKDSMMFSILRGGVAIGIALLVAAALIFISAEGAGVGEKFAATADAMQNLLIRPVWGKNGLAIKSITDIMADMIPIIFTGLATCVMFSANQFNMGGEGGVMLGAFVAGLCAIYIPMPAGIHMVFCLVVGALSVAVMMLIPGILKAKLDVSEMVCSLMLNYIVMYMIKYLMNSFLADKSKGQIMTFPFAETALVPQLVDNGSKLTWGFVVAIIVTVITGLFMYRTRWGYAIRMIGINQEFAKYSGIRVAFIVVLAQVLGGIIAGLGGGIEMLGRYNAFSWGALPGYGWTGMTVAIIAGNNPFFVPFAALFMAYLDKGCSLMATYSGVPAQLIDIVQAVVFVFFAAEQFLSGYRQKLVVRAAKQEILEAEKKKKEEEGGNE